MLSLIGSVVCSVQIGPSVLYHRAILQADVKVLEKYAAFVYRVDPENGGSRYLRNVVIRLKGYTVSQLRISQCVITTEQETVLQTTV
jgi:hypothetical protein